MAVLNKIREKSIFLIIIIALALFSFVLADVIRNGGFSSRKSRNSVAVVNGENIERQDFNQRVEAFQRNMRNGTTTLQAAKQVWSNALQDILLQQQSEVLGLRIGQNQINSMLRQQLQNNPNFLNENGVFDLGVLKEYVANLKATSPQAYNQWLTFENNVASAAKANIYFNLIRAGLGATTHEAKEAYAHKMEEIAIKYTRIPYAQLPDVEISQSAIENYLAEHPGAYQTEASRDIAFVSFEEKPSAEDKQAVKKELVALLSPHVEYNPVTKSNDTIPGFKATKNNKEFIARNSESTFQDTYFFKKDLPKEVADKIFALNVGEVYGPYAINNTWNATKVIAVEQLPDSVKASHILISYKGLRTGLGLSRSKEEAKKMADSLLKVVRNNPEKYDEIAAEFSADKSNKDKGGDLGWFTYGRMVPAFNTFVFAHDKGETGVVETNFGFHIVSIEDQSNTQKAVKLANLSLKILPSEKTINELYATATNFQMNAAKDGFAETAKKAGVKVRYAKGLEILDENIPGIGLKREIVKWTFEEGTQVGAIKRFDVNGGYAIVQLTAKQPKGLMTIDKATALIKPILSHKAKTKAVKEKVSSADLSTIASSFQTTVETVNDLTLAKGTITSTKEPLVLGTAFTLKEGVVSQPIAGNNGVYVLKVVQHTPAPRLPSYAAAVKEETQRNTAEALSFGGNGRVMKALKETAEIKDNRATFY